MSSAESELMALDGCDADVTYCRKLANELDFLQLWPTIIHEDNICIKQLAESGSFKGRSCRCLKTLESMKTHLHTLTSTTSIFLRFLPKTHFLAKILKKYKYLRIFCKNIFLGHSF
jgi:hypothetical protein